MARLFENDPSMPWNRVISVCGLGQPISPSNRGYALANRGCKAQLSKEAGTGGESLNCISLCFFIYPRSKHGTGFCEVNNGMHIVAISQQTLRQVHARLNYFREEEPNSKSC